MAATPDEQARPAREPAASYDAVVVGAGFAGLYMLHRLRNAGHSVRVFEAGSGVGGTWYWNRYPGARCDVESLEYSYSFSEELQQEWEWTERFATQPEILRYLNHVADRFDLRPDIQLEHEGDRRRPTTRPPPAGRSAPTTAPTDVTRAVRDHGDRVPVARPGCRTFPGLDSFRGRTFHTGDWPDGGVDLTGQRVGVIGTGSSGVQVIPLLAEQAARAHRLPAHPELHHARPATRPLTPDNVAYFKAHYPAAARPGAHAPRTARCACSTTSRP